MEKTPKTLNVTLAKTDSMAKIFAGNLRDYIGFFKNKQGAFNGEKKTYTAHEGKVDEPTKRGVTHVATTVDEKLNWFIDVNKEYINELFSQEATNASGNVKAELIVDGESWGEYSSLELLRLKSLLESTDFRKMHSEIPVRSDAENWEPNTDDMYKERVGIFQQEEISYENKATVKTEQILEDPNIKHLQDKGAYVPQVTTINTTETLGEGTRQVFTGKWSHRQRSGVLRRIANLHTAVLEALKRANEAEVVDSSLTANRLFDYLYDRKS